MSKPPIPPRPPHEHNNSLPPPLPPLPPDFRVPDRRYDYESAPHFEDPLVAPRPHRIDPALPANMARNLDDQAASYLDNRLATPAPPQGVNYTPGFAMYSPNPMPSGGSSQTWQTWGAPNQSGAPVPPRPQSGYLSSLPMPQSMPFQPPMHQPLVSSSQPAQPDSLNSAMASLSFSQQPQRQREPSMSGNYSSLPKAPPPPKVSGIPTLTTPLPSISTLSAAIPAIQQPNHSPALKIAWCRDVIFLIDRAQQTNASADSGVGPVRIADLELLRLSQIAVPIILELASPQPVPNPVPAHVAEAIYIRATLEASGGFPDLVPRNLRSAFRDFEQAARGGYAAAWFKLGRDYESFNDISHARDCFERGVKLGVESCTYRMGMAHLMGQLGLPSNPELAVPLLHRAATLASLDVPQPAYVYALLLLSEFSHITVLPQLFAPFIPQGSTQQQEARKHLERAAYLNFAPAQYKLGHAYEFAQPPFPFDALLSVQYYSLASQQGETEADMALSKWFLCGSDGAFEKDEALAYTFAEKAARKGLPSAEFAMGYYAEVGVGGPKDIEASLKWYNMASEHGNTDASQRLRALSQPSPQVLSRQEHDNITENKLVRKRTQAKQRSDLHHTQSAQQTGTPHSNSQQIVAMVRKNSLARTQSAGLSSGQRQRLSTLAENTVPGPRIPVATGISPSASPRPRPQLPGRQLPQHNRYTLMDPGSGSATGPPDSREQSPRPVVRSQSPHLGPRILSSTPDASNPTPAANETVIQPAAYKSSNNKGATTFAEMGFQSAKAEEKECVIM